MTKTTLIILMAFPTSLIVRLFEKYIFNDWHFLISLMILVGLDTLLGFVKHWKTKTLSSRGFGGLFKKFITYSCVLVLTHVLKNFQVSDEANILFSWVDDVMYSAIIVREAISILENVGAISPNLLPAWILAKFKQFDDAGKFNPETNENQSKPVEHLADASGR